MRNALILLAARIVAAICADDNCMLSTEDLCSAYNQDPSITVPAELIEACKNKQDVHDQDRIHSACDCLTVKTPTTSVDFASSSAVTPAPSLPEDDSLSPCALVSSSSSAQRVASPTAVPSVSAQLAYDCLNSVPLNKTGAIQLVTDIVPYLEWQSDSAWKKDPPADYSYPAHDLFGSLAKVKANLEDDHYANEYEFQADLFQVFTLGHDGHLLFYPDALTKAFEFSRQRSLVSISLDGHSLPVIKLLEDVISSPKTASIVTKINGVDAPTYVSDHAGLASFNQDADAAYNSMFYEKVSFAHGGPKGFFSGGGRLRYIYPGPNTTFTFENGTSLTLNNLAKIKGNFSNVTDGQQFYTRFCSEDLPTVPLQNQTDTALARPPPPPGYPPAVIATNDTILAGYYIDGDGYEDVAVMSVPAFQSESISEFQGVAEQFLADARRDGKTKLVIDLSFNGGGYIFQGYDLFRQLFPSNEQDGDSRWRAGETFNAISEVFSATSANYDPSTANEIQINQAETWFNYRFDLNTSNQKFESYADKFGPVSIKGDNFTHTMRWNLNDKLLTSNSTFGLGIDITGYGSRKNFTQPFYAENIVMLHDGFCASTCSIFSEFMRTLAGVKSIAMGGRPTQGPIQALGGIKGSQILMWEDIYAYAQLALLNSTASQTASLKRLSPLPLLRSSSSACNVRDTILSDNLEDGLPAQFVREEADCRLYFTENMITDISAVWKAAADAAFKGKKCVAGNGFPRKAASTIEGQPKSGWSGVTKYVSPQGVEPVKDAAWLAIHQHKAID